MINRRLKTIPELRETAESKITDVIWIQTAFIGDIVLNMAACVWLHENYPHVKQHLITTNLGVEALRGHKALSTVIPFEKRKQSFLKSFMDVKRQLSEILDYKKSSTIILQTHRSARSSLLAKYLGLPTITFQDTALGFLATRRVARDLNHHDTMRQAQLLSVLGFDFNALKISKTWLHPLGECPEALSKIFSDKKSLYIGIATGSVWATKRWPVEQYAELTIRLLRSFTDVKIILLGSAAEKDDAELILSRVAMHSQGIEGRLIDLVAQTKLRDLSHIYPRLDLLISNDSSPVQFASGFNIATVSIFGPTVPRFGFGPVADDSQVVQVDLPCRPCSDHGPMKCPLGHFRCMKNLSVDMVFSKSREILELKRNSRN